MCNEANKLLLKMSEKNRHREMENKYGKITHQINALDRDMGGHCINSRK